MLSCRCCHRHRHGVVVGGGSGGARGGEGVSSHINGQGCSLEILKRIPNTEILFCGSFSLLRGTNSKTTHYNVTTPRPPDIFPQI